MNNVIPQPPVGARDGNWVWDGTRWVCDPDCDFDDQRPPFTVLQPGRPNPFFPPPVTQPPWYPGANGGVSFAPPGSPPPNPIRGAFWWDGKTLWLFDGAAWDVVGPAGGGGVVTPPGTSFPPNPVPGQQFFDGVQLWIWDGNAWVPLSQTKTTISATAPPSPHAGDLWFDGTQLRIWSGSAWMLVGPGATVGPTPTTSLVFSLQQPANIAVAPASTWEIMAYTATPLVDPQTMWDPVQHRMTPKVAGYYFIEVRAGANSGTGGIAILKNDPGTFNSVPNTSNIIIGNASQNNGGWVSAVGIGQFNGTTDFFRIWGWDSTGVMSGVGSSPAVAAVILP